MIHTLAHRGPDGYGFHAEPGVGLAHARLSIIDLATGDQPIHNPARTVWTVFNGEIFNFVELRAELRSEEHTSELQSLMRISYAVFCLKKKNIHQNNKTSTNV